MQEVNATIKFTTPCLGGIRKPVVDEMYRDDEGRVIFLEAWWRSLLSYAAKANGVDVERVFEIRFDPVIDGTIGIFKRFWGPGPEDFKQHEAFEKDQEVGINAMLPDGISIEDFRKLLSTGGTYVGISPYGHKKSYGRFSVLEVRPRCPAKKATA